MQCIVQIFFEKSILEPVGIKFSTLIAPLLSQFVHIGFVLRQLVLSAVVFSATSVIPASSDWELHNRNGLVRT
jgi:hypothetical protein